MTSVAPLVLSVALALPAPVAGAAVATTSSGQRLVRAPHGGATVPRSAPPDSAIGPGRAVPFVAQGDLLCGGAAAAMIERFWGAEHVYAADFADLVRPDEGGIRTDDLAEALAQRGLEVVVRLGHPAAADSALRAGLPAILLLGSGTSTKHYVVLTARRGDTAWIQDPNWGPRRRLSWKRLRERWAASRYWSLVAVGTRSSTWPPASPRAASAPPLHLPDGAMDALRDGRYEEAKEMARSLLLAHPPDPASGWRLMATARWLEGDAAGALGAWNRVGEPVVDLLEVEGLHHVRFHAVAQRSDLQPRELLSPRRLALARRRLETFPPLARVRVDYAPREDGTVTAHVAVQERPRLPTGLTAAASIVAEGLSRQEIQVGAGPFTGAAEWWTVRARWNPASSEVSLSVLAPPPRGSGLVRVHGGWRRERFGSASESAVETQARRTATLSLATWIEPEVRVQGSVGLQRWRDGGSTASGAASLVLSGVRDRDWLRVAFEGWVGSASPFVRGTASAGLRIASSDQVAWQATAGITMASSATPKLLWPGAGLGRVRHPLLRAHPLVGGDRITGPVFGRGVAHATVERFRSWRVGPLRAGWIAFADIAGAWHRAAAGTAGPYVDAGLGARLEMGDRTFDVALAGGEAGWVWSTQVRAGPPWGGS